MSISDIANRSVALVEVIAHYDAVNDLARTETMRSADLHRRWMMDGLAQEELPRATQSFVSAIHYDLLFSVSDSVTGAIR